MYMCVHNIWIVATVRWYIVYLPLIVIGFTFLQRESTCDCLFGSLNKQSSKTNSALKSSLKPGRVAQSVGHLTHKSGVLGSIPGPGKVWLG